MTKRRKSARSKWKTADLSTGRVAALTADELGEIYWAAAHKADESVPWAKLDDALRAEINLGGDDLYVLQVQTNDAAFVALARVEESTHDTLIDTATSKGTAVFELVHLTSVAASRARSLAGHAATRVGRSWVEVALGAETPSAGAKLQVAFDKVVNTGKLVLL